MTMLDNAMIAISNAAATSGASGGTSVFTEGMKTALTDGISDLTATVNDVIGVIIPAAIILICINAGCNFALGKIRGLLGWAQ